MGRLKSTIDQLSNLEEYVFVVSFTFFMKTEYKKTKYRKQNSGVRTESVGDWVNLTAMESGYMESYYCPQW